MRQTGILTAAAIYALEHHYDRLREDHAHAKLLADVIHDNAIAARVGGPVETNIVIFTVDPAWGTAHRFVSELYDRDVHCMAFGPQSIRLVTHLDVA